MDVDGSPRELSADGECEQRSSESESNHGSDVEDDASLKDEANSEQDCMQSNEIAINKMSDEISIGDDNEFDVSIGDDNDLNYDEAFHEEENGSNLEKDIDEMATAISSDSDEDSDHDRNALNNQASQNSPEEKESQKDNLDKNGEEGEFEEGEVDKEEEELEDGEIKSDSDDDIPIEIEPDPVSPAQQVKQTQSLRPKSLDDRPENHGICKWFIKGTCTWGSKCNFIHPKEEDRQIWKQRMNQQQNNRPKILPPQNPPPLMAMNVTVAQPVQQEISAWESGLKKARELMKKKQNSNEGVNGQGDELFSPRSGEEHAYESSSSSTSNRRNRGALPITSRLSFNEQPKIPSLIDVVVPPPDPFGQNRDLGPQTLYPNRRNVFNKRRDRPERSSHDSISPRGMRSISPRTRSCSRSSSFSNKQLKSQATIPSRVTYNNDFNDPWARKSTSRKKRSPRSRSRSSSTKLKPRSRSRSGTYSLVSSSRSPSPVKLTPPKKNRKHRSRSSSSSGSSSDTYKSSSKSRSSSYSSRSSSSSRSSRKRNTKKSSNSRDKSKSTRKSVSPREKRARSGYESTKLRSLLQKSDSAIRTADLSSYRIPKRKRTPSPPSPPRSKRSKKNDNHKEKSRKSGPNSFFDDNDDDTPAAFKINNKEKTELRKPSPPPTPEAQDISSDDEDIGHSIPSPPSKNVSDAETSKNHAGSPKESPTNVSDSSESSDNDEENPPQVSVESSKKDPQTPTQEEGEEEVQNSQDEPMKSDSPKPSASNKKKKTGGDDRKKRNSRQELLEQLKSIEEAIAKKRNKTSV